MEIGVVRVVRYGLLKIRDRARGLTGFPVKAAKFRPGLRVSRAAAVRACNLVE